jgi:hypothetical protein
MVLISICWAATGCAEDGGPFPATELQWRTEAAVETDEGRRLVDGCCTAESEGAVGYQLLAGDDRNRFVIDSETGALSFVETPDFEAPVDANRDNVYEVFVVATSNGVRIDREFGIEVRDVDEPPVFASEDSIDVDEGTVETGYSALALDPEGRAVSYGIAPDGDGGRFEIEPLTGRLRFVVAPDFDTPLDDDQDNVFQVPLRASTQSGDVAQLSLRVTVRPVDRPGPMLVPCPEGWQEVVTDSGTTVCDPWPGGSPVHLDPCPEGWELKTDPDGGPRTCDPWPGTSPVRMRPCPDGWHEREKDGVEYCDPYPAGGRQECGPTEAHFPGTPGCAPIGTPCPTPGQFDPDLPSGRTIVYVAPGALNGTGTSSSTPYGALDEVPWTSLAAGTIVALSTGTFEGVVIVPDQVTIWGACPSGTVLTTDRPIGQNVDDFGVINVLGTNATVRNLGVIQPERVGISAAGLGAVVFLRDVVVDRALALGVFIGGGARIDAERIIARNGRPVVSPTGQPDFGVGIQIESLGGGRVQQALLQDNSVNGLVAVIDSDVSIEDSVALRSRVIEGTDNPLGQGLSAELGSRLRVSRCYVEANETVGVSASREGNIEASWLFARDHAIDSRSLGGPAIGVEGEGSSVTLQHGVFTGNSAALFASNQATADVSDFVVLDALPPVETVGGQGIAAQAGQVRIDRAAILDVPAEGIFAAEGTFGFGQARSSVALTRTVIRPQPLVPFARGIEVRQSTVNLDRVLIERPPQAGIVLDALARVSGRDVVIRALDSSIVGWLANPSSEVEVERVLVEGDFAAHFVGTGASAIAHRWVLRDAGGVARAVDGLSDSAAIALSNSVFEGDSIWIRGGLGHGLWVAGTRLDLRRARIRETIPLPDIGGFGLRVQGESEVSLRDVVIEESVGLAVRVGGESQADLTDVVLRNTRSRESDGEWGGGLYADTAARLTLQRVRATDIRGAALSVRGVATTVQGQNVVLGPTLDRACAPATCSSGAYGATVFGEAEVNLARFEITGAAPCGAYAFRGGSLFLTGGRVEAPVGVCTDAAEFPPEQLEDVEFEVDDAEIETNADIEPLPPIP